MKDQDREKLLNLLADEVLFGLSDAERADLESLKKIYPDLAEDLSFDMTAGHIMLNEIKELSPMPDKLKERILSASEDFFTAAENETARVDQPSSAVKEDQYETPMFSLGGIISSKLGWAFAAAACIALFAVLVFDLREPNTVFVTQIENPKIPTVTEQYKLLNAEAKDLKRTDLIDPADNEKIIGEVVWSEEQQKGFMMFDNLAANDKAKETYQLWIFDESQDEKTPIDGGIFDISANKESNIIAIDAKLRVINPNLFAVTVEKPGGVVVSKREKIAALGKM